MLPHLFQFFLGGFGSILSSFFLSKHFSLLRLQLVPIELRHPVAVAVRVVVAVAAHAVLVTSP